MDGLLNAEAPNLHEVRKHRCCPYCGSEGKPLPIKIDFYGGVVEINGKACRYPVKQLLLLEALAAFHPLGVPRERLRYALWGEHVGVTDPDGCLDTHTSRLKSNLRADRAPFRIEGGRGTGYRLVMGVQPCA